MPPGLCCMWDEAKQMWKSLEKFWKTRCLDVHEAGGDSMQIQWDWILGNI